MILIDDHCNVNLDALAIKYFDFLNPTDGKKFGRYSLVARIQNKQKAALKAGNNIESDFYDFLLENNEIKLREIITGRPATLSDLNRQIRILFGATSFSTNHSYNNAELTNLGRNISATFNYETLYRKKNECPTNCREFRLAYCPYCNAAPVAVINIAETTTGDSLLKALLQLDHFYPIARHPYLALSFFNLVPGCDNCNALLKQEKQFDINTHFNPFHKRLDDYFRFKTKDIIISENDDVEITIDNILPHAKNSLTDFRIIERYNASYKPVVGELIQGLRSKSPKIQRSLFQQFLGILPFVQTPIETLLAIGGVPKDQKHINNFHLGKLKRDICIQLGILHA